MGKTLKRDIHLYSQEEKKRNFKYSNKNKHLLNFG